MSLNEDSPCPPDHVVYLSQMLAENAATLHRMLHCDENAVCQGINPFPHGDHWHIGHETGTKDLCPPPQKQARFAPKV